MPVDAGEDAAEAGGFKFVLPADDLRIVGIAWRFERAVFLILDGHIRIEILKDLGEGEVECLVSTDDEAFTYNKRISRLSAVQEHAMIVRAIARGVPEDKIARALAINVSTIQRKSRLLDGICAEAASLLKDKQAPMALFEILKKMKPMRQIETAELLINANNYSVSYAAALLAGTPQAQLVNSDKPKKVKGVTPEAMARMEQELARLQEQVSAVQDTYGREHLRLTVIKGYLGKLLGNPRVVRYLLQNRPAFLSEFQAIAEVKSTLPLDINRPGSGAADPKPMFHAPA